MKQLPDGRIVILEEVPLTEVRVKIMPNGFLDRRNAARYLGRSVKTLANWKYQGKGPKTRRNGRLEFYHIDDLDDWMSRDGHGA